MAARILDGKGIAGEIRQEVRAEVDWLRLLGRGVPGLGVLLAGDNPASQIYVQSKEKACAEAGIHSETVRLPASADEAQALEVVDTYNRRPEIHAILVQLPLPGGMDKHRVLEAVDPAKDVDGFHPLNVGNLSLKRPGFVPCTPAGILELLRRSGVELAGRRAVVLGRSLIVGQPTATLLLQANATVTVCHSVTRDLAAVAAEGEILVAALGRTAMVTREFIRPGAVVVDVGINRVEDPRLAEEYIGHLPKRIEAFRRQGYTLVGDVHPAHAAERAGACTPVPGGVGPLTIALLLRNTLLAMKRSLGILS